MDSLKIIVENLDDCVILVFLDFRDGRFDSLDAEAFCAVYRSSAKNAMRVARTETNIAYRRADHERWLKMPFVRGKRVQMSHNHPMPDICDDLAGEYPKDFVFDGWHPQCWCYAVPILVDASEMQKANEAFLRGEEYTPQGKPITDYPQGFKDWVRDNAEKIAESRARGTEPYFVRNNSEIVDRILLEENKDKATISKIYEQTEHVALTTKSMYDNTVLEPLSEQKKVDKVQEMTGVTTEKAKEYVDAVESFSHGWDREIREYQNTSTVDSLKQGHTLEEVAEKERLIEEFISKSPQWSAPSYRGIGVSEQEYAAILKSAQDGTLDMRGMASWTSELKDAQRYAYDQRWDKECLVVFENAGDARATSIRHLSLHPDENEVLHSGSNRYQIVGEPIEETIYGRHKVIRIRLEAIQEPMTTQNAVKGASTKGGSRALTNKIFNEIDVDYYGRTKLSDEQHENLLKATKALYRHERIVQPMTFIDADEGKANRMRGGATYENNCSSCVLASELRRRGLDVTASVQDAEVADDTLLCWRTKDNQKPKFIVEPSTLTSSSATKLYSMLERLADVPNGRYSLGWSGNGQQLGHVLCMERINGKLCFYDPQQPKSSCFWSFDEIYALMNKKAGLELLRIDNLLIDIDYMKKLVISL